MPGLSRRLRLTVFVWVLFMNAMDFLPVDIMAWIYQHIFRQEEWRAVPTADVNTTFALSLSVFGADDLLQHQEQGPLRLDQGIGQHALRHQAAVGVAAAHRFQSVVQYHRVRIQAAVAFAAAVRQHVRRRRSFSCCSDSGLRPEWRVSSSAAFCIWAGRFFTS